MVCQQIAQETYPTAPLRAHLSHLALTSPRSTHHGLSATLLYMLFQFALVPVLEAMRSPGPSHHPPFHSSANWSSSLG